jgi:hypothetical protein
MPSGACAFSLIEKIPHFFLPERVIRSIWGRFAVGRIDWRGVSLASLLNGSSKLETGLVWV